jgi:hypothetical protein
MGKVVAVAFRSKALQVERSLESRVRECVKDFSESGSFMSAQNLCRAAFPSCEIYDSRRLANGKWAVEIRYDNLLHEGEGQTEAAALVDAILWISEATRSSEGGSAS